MADLIAQFQALFDAERFEEAAAIAVRVLESQPKNADLWSALGSALYRLGRFADALTCYDKALKLAPDHLNSLIYACALCRDVGQLNQSLACGLRAVEVAPKSALAHDALSAIYRLTGSPREAIIHQRIAVSLKPNWPYAHAMLGGLLIDAGQPEEAIAAVREALRQKPDFAFARSKLLLMLHYAERDPDMLWQEHRRYGTTHGRGSTPAPHTNDRDPDKRLRIGYVSADFRNHSVAFFLEPILRTHSAAFEVFAYSDVAAPDATTARFTALVGADHFRRTLGQTDAQVDALIRGDGIDVLVDLTGHASPRRLLLFARKPAPLQITYLGYPNTTGLPQMDYRVTDAIADPPGVSEAFHSEQLMRLSGGFLCYAAPHDSPERGTTPPRAITFGSFNNLAKVTTPLIALWADILRRLPDARLVLKALSLHNEAARADIAAAFARERIAPDRLDLRGAVETMRGHLQSYDDVDIALDTYPYNGTTTTFEALWMGVPVVTLCGQTHVSRVGASILRHIGLPELVCETKDAYVECALALARDRALHETLHETLRARLSQSSLMNAARLTGELESAVRNAWQKYCARVKPSP